MAQRIFLYIFLLTASLYCKSQFGQAMFNNIDSLSHYSYLIVGVKNNSAFGNATGFFVRKNQKLYLVSNYHVFTFWNTLDTSGIGSRISPSSDTLAVRVFRKIDSGCIFYPINITQIKASSKPKHFWSSPDLYVYQIISDSLIRYCIINSLENYIEKYTVQNGTPDEIKMFGYPLTLFPKGDEYGTARPKLFSGHMYGPITAVWNYHDISKIDSVNYQSDFYSGPGTSGSPVFFVFKQNDNKLDLITFGGVHFGANSEQTRDRYVRPEELKKILDTLP